ncbi:beta-lactamase family protein [Streptomyces sp. SB3404]|uniref:Beta-lactamase family protein n=2 Tax=Streptomyces boncukensis TaxID=2711219 RepID=A0A6G4X459_9ACTN|nr:beta-lactamase family protein [Streptomyces boncukensis]
MSLPRSVLIGLLALVCGFALPSGVSFAADGGHARTHEALHEAVVRYGVPGALGWVQDSGGVWHGSAGVADRRTGRPRQARDRFRIGSLTKPFVATVLLQLEAEGRVRLDDPVGRWLRKVPLGRYGAAFGDRRHTVTVRRLLGHTSGIPGYTADPAFRRAYFGTPFLTERWASHTPRELIAPALKRGPLFTPGTAWSYSNTNYVLAGMVIEAVTGRSYAEEIEHRIVRPLRLRDTSLPGTSPRIPGRHGRAYSALGGRDGERYDVTALNPSLAGASGEMISSDRDLVRFTRELLTGGLLPPRQLREMKSTRAIARHERYGLGLTARTLSCGVTVWGHDGTIHGSHSAAFGTADGSRTAAFNVNADWGARSTRAMVEAEFCG